MGSTVPVTPRTHDITTSTYRSTKFGSMCDVVHMAICARAARDVLGSIPKTVESSEGRWRRRLCLKDVEGAGKTGGRLISGAENGKASDGRCV